MSIVSRRSEVWSSICVLDNQEVCRDDDQPEVITKLTVKEPVAWYIMSCPTVKRRWDWKLNSNFTSGNYERAKSLDTKEAKPNRITQHKSYSGMSPSGVHHFCPLYQYPATPTSR